MITFQIEDVFVTDNVYYVITSNGEASVFSRPVNNDVLELPLWSSILADMIDIHGLSLQGKTFTVDPSNLANPVSIT